MQSQLGTTSDPFLFRPLPEQTSAPAAYCRLLPNSCRSCSSTRMASVACIEDLSDACKHTIGTRSHRTFMKRLRMSRYRERLAIT